MMGLLCCVALSACNDKNTLEGVWVLDKDRTILENKVSDGDIATMGALEISSAFSYTITGDKVHVSMKPYAEADCHVTHEGQSVIFDECSLDDMTLTFELYGEHLVNRENNMQYFWMKQGEQ